MPGNSPSQDLFTQFTRPLERLGLRYMVTGSVASIVYGEPRLTHDVDLVLELRALDAMRFVAEFPDDDFYCAPEEVIRVEARRPNRGHFNIIEHDSGFKADVYLMGRDPLHAWAMEHRRRIQMGDDGVWLAPPEYVIVRKLQYHDEGGSEKHIRDITAMFENLGEGIDHSQVVERVERHIGASALAVLQSIVTGMD